MILPYVYRLTHKESGQFYIGYRYANRVQSYLDLGCKYFSSSPTIKSIGFENFNIEIIAEFFKADDAYEFENELIRKNFKDPLLINKFYTINEVRFNTIDFKHPTGHKLPQEHKDNISKSLRGKYMGKDNHCFGKKLPIAHKEKISKALKGKKHSQDARRNMSSCKQDEKHPASKFTNTERIYIAKLKFLHGWTTRQIHDLYKDICDIKTIFNITKKFEKYAY